MRLFTFLLSVVFVLSINNSYSKSNFISQLPNGSVNSCATCHVSNSNYSLNSFGSTINSKYLSSGKVVWNSALAALDSDGDGFPNGTELQDPSGTWKSGSSAPGDPSKVSNPGVKSSIPTSVNDEPQTNDFASISIYPNPFTQRITVTYNLQTLGFVTATVFDIVGNLINTLISDFQSPGDYTLYWDGKNKIGQNVSSGRYFVSIQYQDNVITKSINYIQ